MPKEGEDDERAAKRHKGGALKKDPESSEGPSVGTTPAASASAAATPKASIRPKAKGRAPAKASTPTSEFLQVLRQIVTASHAAVGAADKARQVAAHAAEVARRAVEDHISSEGGDPPVDAAKVTGTFEEVYRGEALITQDDGLKKSELMVSMTGKIVVKTAEAEAAKQRSKERLQKARQQAQNELGFTLEYAKYGSSSTHRKEIDRRAKELYNHWLRQDKGDFGPLVPPGASAGPQERAAHR